MVIGFFSAFWAEVVLKLKGCRNVNVANLGPQFGRLFSVSDSGRRMSVR